MLLPASMESNLIFSSTIILMAWIFNLADNHSMEFCVSRQPKTQGETEPGHKAFERLMLAQQIESSSERREWTAELVVGDFNIFTTCEVRAHFCCINVASMPRARNNSRSRSVWKWSRNRAVSEDKKLGARGRLGRLLEARDNGVFENCLYYTPRYSLKPAFLSGTVPCNATYLPTYRTKFPNIC
jgi:hypothetical protein